MYAWSASIVSAWMGWERIEEREEKAYLRWCRNARGWIRTSSIPWKTLVSVEGEERKERTHQVPN